MLNATNILVSGLIANCHLKLILLRKVKSRIVFFIVINLLSHTLQNSFWLK